MESIETEVPIASSRLGTQVKNKFVNNDSGLKCFKYFPQPVFRLQQDMVLVETNDQGNIAISENQIGLKQNNKLHFNSRDNDNYVRDIINTLTRNVDSIPSERFILRSIDMQHRVFTIALESPNKKANLILTIHDDLSSKERMMQSFTRAYGLSSSESKIIKMMVKGLKPKEIAFELGISLNTVRSHLRTLYAKMQVRSYNDALTQAIKLIC